MGGKNSKDKIQAIDMSMWQKISEHPAYDLLRNTKTSQYGQIRSFIIDPRLDISRQMQIYSYRRNHDGPFVRSIAASNSKGQKTTMCGKSQIMNVITEKISRRWSEVPQVSYAQSLYALDKSLKGYSELYDKAGPFQVTPNMIGVTQGGQVKVWLNQNFADNHPNSQKPVLQTTASDFQSIQRGVSSQANMVQNVIDVIQRKCEGGQFPYNLRAALQNNCNSFDQANTILNQVVKTTNLYLPSRLSISPGALNSASMISNNNTNQHDKKNNNQLQFRTQNMANTNRFTMLSSNSSSLNYDRPLNIQASSPYYSYHSPQHQSIRMNSPSTIRVSSPPPRTVFSGGLPVRMPQYTEIPTSRRTVPSFGPSNGQNATTRFTYSNNPIETSQITHKFY